MNENGSCSLSCRGNIMADKKELWIAVDFDGTLVLPNWPTIGSENPYAVKVVKRFRRDGFKIMLHTCRQGSCLEDAVLWMKSHNINPDAINDNPYARKLYGTPGPKIFADLYIDDHNVFIKRTRNNAVDWRWINRNYNKIITQINNTVC